MAKSTSGNGQVADGKPSEDQAELKVAQDWLDLFLNGRDAATIPEIFHATRNSIFAGYGTWSLVPVAVPEEDTFELRAERAFQDVPKPTGDEDATDIVDAVRICNKPRSKDSRKYPFPLALRAVAIGICVEKSAEQSTANIEAVEKLINSMTDPETVANLRARISRELKSLIQLRRPRRGEGKTPTKAAAPTLPQDFNLSSLKVA